MPINITVTTVADWPVPIKTSTFYREAGSHSSIHPSRSTALKQMFNKYYSKYSKISNTFLFLFSNEMLVLGAGIHKMIVRIANR